MKAPVLVVVVVAMIGCKIESRQPSIPVAAEGVMLATIPLGHLSTRVPIGSTVSIRLTQTPSTFDLDSAALALMQQTRVERLGGSSIATSVERKNDHWGVGFDVAWERELEAGWYALRFPLGDCPEPKNSNEFHLENGIASYFFRVGSFPVVRKIVKCERAGEVSFAIVLSENVRAEAGDLRNLVELYSDGALADCHSASEAFSTVSQDFSLLFTTLYMTCRDVNSLKLKFVLSGLKTPEGRALQRVDETDSIVDVQWDEAARVSGGDCSTWFEPRLPL